VNQRQRWQFCGVLGLVALLPLCWSGSLPELMWQRDALANGQYWRLLTAHLVHVNLRHLLLNLLGLLLIVELLSEELALAEAWILLLCSALGVSLLLWLCQPQLLWYAGLSGVLHGLWVGFAGAGFLRKKNLFYTGALLLLAAKLACAPAANAGMPVVPVAHLYGALSGLLWLALRFCSGFRLK
jgi:rhomboid family GlyGly-CTERM serine protease